jgi:hypothetical protein
MHTSVDSRACPPDVEPETGVESATDDTTAATAAAERGWSPLLAAVRRERHAVLGLALLGGLLAMPILCAAVLGVEATHRLVLFVHLAALVVGFGAVLVADYHGLLWLLGRRSLRELVRVTKLLHFPIWIGLVGLVASGVFLNPDLDLFRTRIKLVLVAVATVNGLWVARLSRHLDAHDHDHPETLRPSLLYRVLFAGFVSQVAWWGATLIGFIAATSR